MWNDITAVSKILIRQQYEILVRCDDLSVGVYIIEYAYDPHNSELWGCDRYMLVTEEEQEHIENRRMSSEKDDSVGLSQKNNKINNYKEN